MSDRRAQTAAARFSDEERARRREADREESVKAVAALQSSEGWQAWLASRRHFHRYSLANQLLIAMQCPEATRVAGFRAWLKLGYCVRKGERAIRIWVPIAPSKAKLDAWKASGSDPASSRRPSSSSVRSSTARRSRSCRRRPSR